MKQGLISALGRQTRARASTRHLSQRSRRDGTRLLHFAAKAATQLSRSAAVEAEFDRSCGSLDAGGCEELQRDAVGVAERDTGAVAGVLDAVVGNAQLAQAVRPLLQLAAAAAGEGDVVETGSTLVEASAGWL